MSTYNNYGLFFIDNAGQKFLYKSYASMDAIYHALQFDDILRSIEKTKLIIVVLDEQKVTNVGVDIEIKGGIS